MANPIIINLPANTVVKIASAVRYGVIYKKQTLTNYYQTYRIAGDSAPNLPIFKLEMVEMFVYCGHEIIQNDFNIDVYAAVIPGQTYKTNQDGEIRIDL